MKIKITGEIALNARLLAVLATMTAIAVVHRGAHIEDIEVATNALMLAAGLVIGASTQGPGPIARA
ncbi:hypothetical protein HUT06_21240 [Actinomadura sp. NAK00032]|uniref:hypothetical protein n=1 Tax=Actinomadura sp. NAK00032 TaxID=2742128 RepID=UPI0015914AF2|nr:hypothetical protein [Actinomadura sp. NAK00032]QKW36245.1 hypothetical protein HUT06_21240 [Actinomadura sp. NAK00032]